MIMKTTAIQTPLHKLMAVAKKYSIPPGQVATLLGVRHQTLSAWRRRGVLPSSYIPIVEDLTEMIISLGKEKLLPVSESKLISYGLAYLTDKSSISKSGDISRLKGESRGNVDDEKEYGDKLSSSGSSKQR